MRLHGGMAVRAYQAEVFDFGLHSNLLVVSFLRC
jgi:hypothetical protein